MTPAILTAIHVTNASLKNAESSDSGLNGPRQGTSGNSESPSINGVLVSRLPRILLYPFFLVHMFAFGLSGFLLAYAGDADLFFIYMHGGIAVTVYLSFYLSIFGRDEVLWMFINAALGILGIYSQLGWILALFGRNVGDYPWYLHVIPATYYVLYTFLLRQMLIDITRSRSDPSRRRAIEFGYVGVSLAVYGVTLWRNA